MSHYLGQCASLTGKNYFSNLVSVQQLGTLLGRRRIATNLGMSIKYHTDACGKTPGKHRPNVINQSLESYRPFGLLSALIDICVEHSHLI